MSPELDNFIHRIRAADQTKRQYRSILENFLRWRGHLPQDASEVQEYVDYRESLGKAPQTLASDGNACNRYLASCGIATRRIERPPVYVQLPNYLLPAQIRQILDALPNAAARCLLALLYDTGARIAEILRVQIKDIKERYLIVTRKGGRTDHVAVSSWGWGYLNDWLGQRGKKPGRLFLDWDYHRVRNMFRTAAESIGITNFRIHGLRHARAVDLRASGKTWEEIGYQLGHVNPTTTVKYYTRPMIEHQPDLPEPTI